MKKFLLATTSVVALTQVAGAQPIASWTGFYIGAQGGLVSHHGKFDDTSGGGIFSDASGSKLGGTFGGYAGYNLQQGGFVFGVEADASWVGAKASATSGGAPFLTTTFFDVNWLATLRGRFGVAYDLTLFYVTGGVAFAGVENTAQNAFAPPGFTEDKTRVGWTIGGGAERRIGSNWTLRGEFRYVDLGRSGTLCVPGGGGCTGYTGTFKNTLVEGIVGLGVKF